MVLGKKVLKYDLNISLQGYFFIPSKMLAYKKEWNTLLKIKANNYFLTPLCSVHYKNEH